MQASDLLPVAVAAAGSSLLLADEPVLVLTSMPGFLLTSALLT